MSIHVTVLLGSKLLVSSHIYTCTCHVSVVMCPSFQPVKFCCRGRVGRGGRVIFDRVPVTTTLAPRLPEQCGVLYLIACFRCPPTLSQVKHPFRDVPEPQLPRRIPLTMSNQYSQVQHRATPASAPIADLAALVNDLKIREVSLSCKSTA